MDERYINPFIESFDLVMPQLGFTDFKKGGLSEKGQELLTSGVIILVGIVGAVKGNVAYHIDLENAKNLASTMMMGMPVEELDEMAQSALSELTNMLTASAATCFYDKLGIKIDISTPTLFYGNNISVKMSSKKVFGIELSADNNPIEISLAFEE